MQTTTQPTGIAVREQKNDNRIFAALLIFLGVVLLTAISLQLGVVRLPVGTTASAIQARAVEPLPFGPGWAADYGTSDIPFGPGWAANYGVQSNQVLPFGPEQAAVYGTHSNKVLPFGPGYAADYGIHSSQSLPFGPGLAATYGVAAH